jgi:hypothetical protein
VVDGRRSLPLVLLYGIGIVLAMGTVSGRYFFASLLVWVGPIAFLGGGTRVGMDWRLASPIWAIQAVACGIAALGLRRFGSGRRAVAGTPGAMVVGP